MSHLNTKITIVGAGISGLIAALNLEEKGFSTTIYEKTSSSGGRVKTDVIEGHRMDLGFQVLLDAYPMAQKYLNLEALKLQKFLPGAVIFKDGKAQTLGDPLRDLSLLLPTLASGLGTFADKFKILALNRELKKIDAESIFKEPETTTLQFLQNKGFSQNIINDFFKPFFSGIFLEPDLKTSSRMFRFVYKMFGEGLATLPLDGIRAISKQLEMRLQRTEIIFDTEVTEVSGQELVLKDNTLINSDYIIIATPAAKLVPNLRGQGNAWKGCDTLYFSAKKRAIDKPLIGLIASKKALINNIFYLTSLGRQWSDSGELLCVTVVKSHNLDQHNLVTRVQNELKEFCEIDNLSFIKHYQIARGLPDLSDVQYDLAPSESQLTEHIFLAGDQLLNGSLNAAMISGERAAQGIIEIIEGNRGVV